MAVLTLPTTPAERFACLLAGYRRAMAALAHRQPPLQALLGLVYARLGRIASRFARLAARVPANAPPRPHRNRPHPDRPHPNRPDTPGPPPQATALQATAPRAAAANRWAHLPRRPGWLLRLVPPMVYPAKSQLEYLLADPAMAALLAASPGLRRTIRPLCRMLGLDPPPAPRPPPDPAPPDPAPPDPAPPAPAPAASAAGISAPRPASLALPAGRPPAPAPATSKPRGKRHLWCGNFVTIS